MCVSFRVIDLFAPVSSAEQISIQTLCLGLSSLINGVPGPMVTSLMPVLQSLVSGPLPLHMPRIGPQKAPLLTPRGTGATSASAIRLALSRASARLNAGLKQRRRPPPHGN